MSVLPISPKAGEKVKTTLFPITLNGERLPVRADPPRRGQHTRELLASLGYTDTQIDQLRAKAAVN